MHELAFTQSILEIAQRHASRAGARRVRTLRLVLGELSTFVDDSVQFYWDFIAKGTICEGARLEFERVPARLTCLDCEATWPLAGELTACPTCGSARVRITGGDDFRLDSIEVDTDEPEEGT